MSIGLMFSLVASIVLAAVFAGLRCGTPFLLTASLFLCLCVYRAWKEVRS